MGGCGRGICIWLETITLENAPWLYVVIVWLNDLRIAGVKRYMEINKGGSFFPPITAAFTGQFPVIFVRGG